MKKEQVSQNISQVLKDSDNVISQGLAQKLETKAVVV